MDTVYPNNLTREKYTKVVLLSYTVKYEDMFTYAQIKEPIELLIDRIDHILSQFKKPEYKKLVLLELKNIYQKNSSFSKISPESGEIIANYFSGNEKKIKFYTENLCKIKFPDQFRDEYVHFISEVSHVLLKQICEETERAILKYSSNNSNQSKSNDNSSNKKRKINTGDKAATLTLAFSINKKVKFSDEIEQTSQTEQASTFVI